MIETIEKAKSIGIVGHVNGDGDSIGSTLGFYTSLKLLGKEVILIKNTDVPDHLQFLKGLDQYSQEEPKELDLVILLDLNEYYRTGEIGLEWIKKAKELACIDHHLSDGDNFKFSYINKDASSTSQLISEFIRKNSLPMNSDIATYLYTGITTDTNRYLYNNSRVDAMKESIYLIENGADVDTIYSNLFASRKLEEFEITSEILKNGKYFYKNQGIVLYISDEILNKYSFKSNQIGFIKTIVMEFKQVKVSVIITEKENEYKVSLRSKGDLDISGVAQSFGGGGHKNASGFAMKKNDINIASGEIIKRIEKEIYK